MVTHECDTCHGEAEVLTMMPGFTGEPVESMVDCPDCEGEGWIEVPDRFERLVGIERAERIRRPYRRAQRRVRWARARWAERDAEVVAAVTYAHPSVLDDEPQLRGMIDHELLSQLQDVTPLRWRVADARLALRNVKRALRGLPPLSPPDTLTSVEVSREGSVFERNVVAIRAERYRKPSA